MISCVFVGEMCGALIAGRFADKYGRRVVSLASMLLISVAGIMSAAAPNVVVFIILRTFVGVGIGCFVIPFDLCAEVGEGPAPPVPTVTAQHRMQHHSCHASGHDDGHIHDHSLATHSLTLGRSQTLERLCAHRGQLLVVPRLVILRVGSVDGTWIWRLVAHAHGARRNPMLH